MLFSLWDYFWSIIWGILTDFSGRTVHDEAEVELDARCQKVGQWCNAPSLVSFILTSLLLPTLAPFLTPTCFYHLPPLAPSCAHLLLCNPTISIKLLPTVPPIAPTCKPIPKKNLKGISHFCVFCSNSIFGLNTFRM